MFRAHGNMTVGQFKLSMGLKGTLYAPRLGALEDNRTLHAYNIDGSFAVYLDEDQDEWQPPAGLEDEFDFGCVGGDEIYLVPAEVGLNPTRMNKQQTRQKKQKMLDGYALLTSCGVDLPEECCKAELSNPMPPFTAVAVDHMREFVNLTFLELSGNRLQLEDLETLPVLEELRIACNQMESIKLSESPRTDRSGGGSPSRPSSPPSMNPFPFLNVLDLGFNFIDSASVLELTCIPNLLDLNLSSNDLLFLPRDMSGFRNLRRLSLRGNKLGEAYEVKNADVRAVMERRQLASDFNLTMNPDVQRKGRETANDGKQDQKESAKLFPAYTRLGKRDSACLLALSSIPKLEELDMSENFLVSLEGGILHGDPLHSFHRLKFLSLTMNTLDTSQRLLPLSEYPSLEWVDVRGNPFNEVVVWNKTWEVLYPECYQQLTIAKGICIVCADPKPSVSFLDHDGHIMKPPAEQPKPRKSKHKAQHTSSSSPSSSTSTARVTAELGGMQLAARRRSHADASHEDPSSIHSRLQLKNLSQQQPPRHRGMQGDSTFLTTAAMMDEAAQPVPPNELHGGGVDGSGDDGLGLDEGPDSARSIVDEGFSGQFDPKRMAHLFEENTNPAEFDQQKLLLGRHSTVAKKAARALKNLLEYPVHGAPKREQDLPRYARSTHQTQARAVKRVARRRNYTVNSNISQRTKRRPKVAEVYTDMANVLDAIEVASAASFLDDSYSESQANTPMDSARSDMSTASSVYDRRREKSVRNARNRRAKMQERAAVEGLLSAVQTKLLHKVL